MVDPLPIDPQQASGLDRLGNLGGQPSPQKTDGERAGAAEFRVMLERLEARATNLAEESRGVENPGELGRAVDSARASLEEALSLKDQLLEAYRQAERQDGESRTREAS